MFFERELQKKKKKKKKNAQAKKIPNLTSFSPGPWKNDVAFLVYAQKFR